MSKFEIWSVDGGVNMLMSAAMTSMSMVLSMKRMVSDWEPRVTLLFVRLLGNSNIELEQF